MKHFMGKGVYGAFAIGKAEIFRRTAKAVERRQIANTAQEKARLASAKDRALGELSAIYESAKKEIGEANAEIFAIHMMMLEDEDYNESILHIIDTQEVNAEYAVMQTGENFARMFSAMEDSYMRARAADIRDISNRLVLSFTEQKTDLTTESDPVILCADDLAPSETVSLEKNRVLAFVTAHGTLNSHTAILARNMNIPAVVGVGEEFLSAVEEGQLLTVDGYSGEVTLSPSEEKRREIAEKQSRDREQKALLQKLRGKDNVTRDGRRVNIFANIGAVDQIGAVLLSDAGGIGLFRSEFLYLDRADFPTEEESFKAYKEILESMGGKKVIVRTLDIGADKQAPYFNIGKEENPALGMRAVRLCLTRPEVFRTQMRALYRASAYGNLSVMFPMITSEDEVKSLLSICTEVKEELRTAGIPFSDRVEIGIMIETPAAAIISDRLAPLVDFFSVGTNDLIQYTLACDRQNPSLEPFCNPHHEAVLRLIRFAAESAHRHDAWIGICGELAADTSLTRKFLNMGIDELSVSPGYVLRLRDTVRGIDLSQ